MRPSFFAAAGIFAVLAGGAFAQSSPLTNVPAPPPTVTAPAVVPGAPVAALTDRDAAFIAMQLENNMVEIAAARQALEHSQNPNVRGLAEKMITDHNYAQGNLQSIATLHHVQVAPMPSDLHRATLDRLGQLSGPAFDREYVTFVMNDHAQEISEFNTELPIVVDAHVSAWTQNTRPMLLQHQQIVQQLLTSLPPAG